MTGLDRLTGRPARVLGAGIVVLESEEQVAAAAISTEEFGGLIGGAVGGVLIDGSHLDPSRFDSAYLLFAATLAVGAVAATRSRNAQQRDNRHRP